MQAAVLYEPRKPLQVSVHRQTLLIRMGDHKAHECPLHLCTYGAALGRQYHQPPGRRRSIDNFRCERPQGLAEAFHIRRLLVRPLFQRRQLRGEMRVGIRKIVQRRNHLSHVERETLGTVPPSLQTPLDQRDPSRVQNEPHVGTIAEIIRGMEHHALPEGRIPFALLPSGEIG